jgi:CDP-paratose 2-epimerase
VNRGFFDAAAPITEAAPADHRHQATPANPEIGFALWPFFGDHVGIEADVADMVELARGRPVMARVQVSWADWARPGDGPRWLDYLINRLHDAGIEIFPTFMWTPPSLGTAPISSAAPRDPGAFAWFVGHVLERYGRLISPYVQFWNEANGSCYWVRELDPSFEIFARMHIWAARVAREEHGRKVVLAGVIPAGGPQWIDQMRGHGVLEHTDLVAVHGFPGTWLPRRIGWRHLLERVDQVLRRHGVQRRIWICEASYSTMRRPGRRSLEHEFRQLSRPFASCSACRSSGSSGTPFAICRPRAAPRSTPMTAATTRESTAAGSATATAPPRCCGTPGARTASSASGAGRTWSGRCAS